MTRQDLPTNMETQHLSESDTWKYRAESAAKAHARCLELLNVYEQALQQIASRKGGRFGILLSYEMEEIAVDALLSSKGQ